MKNRIALGTVQFGLPYGIANQAGQVGRDVAASILEYAQGAGIDTLDTAIAYGESEQRLGEIGVDKWRVVSKLPAIPPACSDVTRWVHDSVQGSLARLRIPRLHGLLLHRSQQLLESQGEELYRAMDELKCQGKVGKIGVSIYSPGELENLWPHYQIDMVQAPFNVFDQRLILSGWMDRMQQAGTEIHVRSVFLQGLLLMEPGRRPEAFNKWEPLWGEWHRWLNEQSLTPLQACLGFAFAQRGIDRIVIGVESLSQLREVLACAESTAIPPKALATEDLNLIDPSCWRSM